MINQVHRSFSVKVAKFTPFVILRCHQCEMFFSIFLEKIGYFFAESVKNVD
jgi:hypothetical protein